MRVSACADTAGHWELVEVRPAPGHHAPGLGLLPLGSVCLSRAAGSCLGGDGDEEQGEL